MPSPLGIAILSALGQAPDGLRLGRVADAVRAPLSSVDAALRKLTAAGLVGRSADRRYLAGDTPEADLLIRLGLRTPEGLAAAARANDAVLYAGHDVTGWLIAVRGRRGNPAFAKVLGLPGIAGGPVEIAELETLSAAEIAAYRERAERAVTIAGAARRAFPRARRPGRRIGRPLHALARRLRAPSARRLRAIAREYGLRRIVAFGSAVRSDFDDESDVDLLIEPRPGHQLGITDLTALEDRLSDAFDRRVEVLGPSGLLPEVLSVAEREGVVLLG